MQKNIGLYLIVDGGYTRNFSHFARMAFDEKVSYIQYRDKLASDKQMKQNTQRLADLAQEYNGIIIVNDNVEVAQEIPSVGIHVGQHDMPITHVQKLLPERIVGISAENEQQAIEADAAHADYIGVGPIFPTKSKADAAIPIGLNTLKRIVNNTHTPIVAIGGITEENLVSVLETGVSGVAIISAILAAPEPQKAIHNFMTIIARYQSQEG